MREKITTRIEEEFIPLSEKVRNFLQVKRNRARRFLSIITENQLPGYIYGSVARGDVSQMSDIDIVIPYPISSMQIELTLEKYQILDRRISQATPNHTPKAHIEFPNDTTVTFPLVPFRDREENFYYFAGVCTLDELLKKQLKAGVNKRLELVQPVLKNGVQGFLISPVIEHESRVAKLLDISLDVIQERVRVLTQRDKRGRTGVYLHRHLDQDEQFEKVLHALKAENVSLRRFLQRRSR